MNNLNLPHPKLMAVAVPANLRCGRPDGEASVGKEAPDWAPLTLRFSGVWEIEPMTLLEYAAALQIVDVREAPEFIDRLGHLPNAKLVPLSQLTNRLGELDPERPVVAVCRSGVRSAQASVLLTKAGFGKVANLAGGMLRWKAEELPVAQGSV
jgi:rhodanese-related sulfurtransferase